MRANVSLGERLELRQEAGGLRHYLAGEPIHAGEVLELLLDDGSWALGRYEWSYRKEEGPWFYVDTDVGDCLDIDPEHSWFRWPGSAP